MKNEKQKIEAEIRSLQNMVYKIDNSERHRKNQKYVGRFFKYRNCASCPEKPSDYWQEYIAAHGLHSDGSLNTTWSSLDSYGDVRIHKMLMRHPMDGMVEISKTEYMKRCKRILEHAEKLIKGAK